MTIMAQKVELTDTWIRTSRVTTGKESIHSGHFMVSDFEAEAQDDEDELAVPVPEVAEPKAVIPCKSTLTKSRTTVNTCKFSCNQLSIETSLTKLFQCMSIAYRQKLTSPKWNRFKGVRLRWKDKIRLNNVIWRCWHMQFINKQNTLVCQFASPLDVDTHNKPEAIVLEGKYWKRKLNAVTAEYKKWRMYTHNQILGRPEKYGHDLLAEFESYEWQAQPSDGQMMVDEDYMGLMSDTLFSTITGNVPFPFPDTREIARGANLADFIQPSLVQLQPSLDEFMDIEPLHDLLCSRLATVPEELSSPLHSLTYSTPKPTTSAAAPPTSTSSAGSRLEQSYQQQQQTGGSYPPLWYIPPYTQQAAAPQPQPPPPPPPYRSPPVPPPPPPPRKEEPVYTVAKLANKPKLKHVSRSQPGGNMKLISTNSAPSLLQTEMPVQTLQASASTSHQQQQQQQHQQKQQQQKQQQRQQRNNSSSALLEQLLTTSSSGSLFSFMGNEPSSQPKMGSSATQRSQCVDVSFLPGQFDQLDNQLLYQNAPSDILNKTSTSYGLSQEQSSTLPQPKTEAVSPPRCAYVMSPIHQPPLPPLNASGGSPESPSQEQLSLSPLSMGSPTSPSGKFIPGYKEHRRVCHINAEQKRRCNIKNGFDTLHSLIPQLNQNPNAKMSKAAMLQKGADYIVQLRNERNSLKQEMESLRQQIDALNSAICNCQSMLPVTGAPISRHRSNKMKDMYRQYIRVRTSENWKFWILSLICEPLLESFNNNVSTNSLEELYQTTLQWIDQHCTLVDLRPVVLNALRYLCTTTEVLSDPARLPIEARAALEKSPKKPNS